MANPIVIDISHWQPDPIDWGKIVANGTIGVILKATESNNYLDPTLYSRASAASKLAYSPSLTIFYDLSRRSRRWTGT